MHALVAKLLDWYTQSLATGGYPLIVLLMAMESSLVPLPSEFVIPPAVLLATGRGNMTVVGIVLAGTLGSWIGATVMYWASRAAGRPLVITGPLSADYWSSRLSGWPRLAGLVKHVLLTPEKVEQAERWSARFGSTGVFGSRMLPVIRHLIGIPSGIVRFNFLKYTVYTVAGSLIWCTVLARVAIVAGSNQALMNGDVKTITVWLAGSVVVLGGLYYFFVYRFTRAPR